MTKITLPLFSGVIICSFTCCFVARSHDRLDALTEQQGQEFNTYIKSEKIRLQILNKNIEEMQIGEWQRRYLINIKN